MPKTRKLKARVDTESKKKLVHERHEQLPCWCGRATIYFSQNEPEVCTGCNEPVGLCNCKPMPA